MPGEGEHTTVEGTKVGFFTRAREAVVSFFRSRAGQGAVPAIASVAAGFLFARTPLLFGAYPLGLALLCAGRRQSLPCFLGVALGAASLGMRGIAWGVLYMAALLVRLLLSIPQTKIKVLPESPEVFGEATQLRVVTALVVSTLASAYEILISSPTRDTLLFALVMVVASPALTAIFYGLFACDISTEDLLGKRRGAAVARSRGERLWLEAAVVFLLFFVAFCVRENSIFGINIGYLFSAFTALYIARRFGALRGCVAGLVVSMAVSTVFAPAFGFLGLLSGALWQLGAIYALGLGAAAGSVWGAYAGGLTGFLGTAPEIWVATLVALPLLPKLHSSAIAEEVQRDRSLAEDAVRTITAREGEGDRIVRLADAFDALSRAFAEKRATPDPDVLRGVCDEICTGYCAACPGRAACWEGNEPPAAAAVDIIARHIAEGKQIGAGDLPTRLITDCASLDRMLADLRLAGARLWCRTTGAGADYPAPDYALTAELLREAAKTGGEEQRNDPALASVIRKKLAEKGIRPAAVSVRGKRHRRIVVGSNALSGRMKDAAQLLGSFEEVCGCRLSSPRFETDGGVITMEMHAKEQFELEVAIASRPAAGSDTSGDVTGVFASPDGFTYLLLADGMGTGKRAAYTAASCALFLEKMLSAGNSEETSLKMLNRMVTMQDGECSASVDLLTFDLCYGHASFMKSGAAASYIRRDGNLFRMRSRTIPLGIVSEVDAERTAFETRPGDVIIMLSDGVSQTSEDAPWLIELLSHPLGTNLDAAAQGILEKTIAHGGAGDDMSVILARVKKAEK